MIEHKNIFEAQVAIMAAVDPIAKDRDGPKNQYKFRGVDDVYQALQKIMSDHGVFTTSELVGAPDYREYSTSSGGTSFRTRAVFRFTFWHVSGTSVSSETIGEGMDSGDKASNKSMSVAHKYALLQVYMIPTDDPKDPEGQGHDITGRLQTTRPPIPSANRPPQSPQSPQGQPGTPPQVRTKRTDTIKLFNESKPKMTDADIARIRESLTTAGTTDALLDAVAADVRASVAKWEAATDAAGREFDSPTILPGRGSTSEGQN